MWFHTLCKANLLHTSSGRHSKRIFNGAQYMTLQKYFFTFNFSYLLFSNHTHQIKIGTTNSWKTLVTKHLDQSLWLPNPKQGEYLDYIYYITLSYVFEFFVPFTNFNQLYNNLGAKPFFKARPTRFDFFHPILICRVTY